MLRLNSPPGRLPAVNGRAVRSKDEVVSALQGGADGLVQFTFAARPHAAAWAPDALAGPAAQVILTWLARIARLGPALCLRIPIKRPALGPRFIWANPV